MNSIKQALVSRQITLSNQPVSLANRTVILLRVLSYHEWVLRKYPNIDRLTHGNPRLLIGAFRYTISRRGLSFQCVCIGKDWRVRAGRKPYISISPYRRSRSGTWKWRLRWLTRCVYSNTSNCLEMSIIMADSSVSPRKRPVENLHTDMCIR